MIYSCYLVLCPFFHSDFYPLIWEHVFCAVMEYYHHTLVYFFCFFPKLKITQQQQQKRICYKASCFSSPASNIRDSICHLMISVVIYGKILEDLLK